MDLGTGEARPDRPGLDPLFVSLIGAEVARILHTIHLAKPSLAHLNLCPGNVVVGRTGEVKLLDTGIAASLRGFTLQPIERWYYVAPEVLGKDLVFRPLPEQGAIAADLYSLGSLMFQMLTGRLQSEADSIEALHAQKARPRFEEPHLPPNLVAALRALLSPDMDDRPQSALAVVDWLATEVPTQTRRQEYIAKGIAMLEKGSPVLSQEIPVLADAQPLDTTTSKSRCAETPQSLTQTPELRMSRRKRGLYLGLVVVALVGLLGLFVALQEKNPGIVHPIPKTQPANPEIVNNTKRSIEPTEEVERKRIPRVSGHLVVDTIPPGAVVWVDGKKRGKTFADLMIGEGGHRILVIAPGHKIFREVVDTTHGIIIRRTLVPIEPPTKGDGFLTVECKTKGDYPILLDEEETGLLCPAQSIPVASGKHLVGIFLPTERKSMNIEVIVASGNKETIARFNE
jgi:serine/threonine-protein kinase